VSEPELDYSDKITIVITRVRFMGEPTHWEYDVEAKGDIQAGGTGPSFYHALDGAIDYLGDEMREWVAFNSNEVEGR
jgi:hypothetical protein